MFRDCWMPRQKKTVCLREQEQQGNGNNQMKQLKDLKCCVWGQLENKKLLATRPQVALETIRVAVVRCNLRKKSINRKFSKWFSSPLSISFEIHKRVVKLFLSTSGFCFAYIFAFSFKLGHFCAEKKHLWIFHFFALGWRFEFVSLLCQFDWQ